LLEQNIIPILVGGTHYYIQSVIWDLLIDKAQAKTSTCENSQARPPKRLETGK